MDILGRQLTNGLDIGIHLKVNAALELGTLTSQVLRVQGDVLEAGGTRGHRHKSRHPRSTAERSSTRADAANASSLLARTDLLHLDTNPEDVGQHLDQLAKVHALVGDIIENRLVAVALVLDVANLHLQSQIDSDFAGTDHGVFFASLSLLITFHIGRLGFAEYTQYLGILAQVHTLHLVLNQTSCETYPANVMSRIGFDSHPITLLEGDVGAVAVKAATGILEEHLDNVKVIVRHIIEPVGAGEVAAADVRWTATPATTALDTTGVSAVRQIHLQVIVLVHCGTHTRYLA